MYGYQALVRVLGPPELVGGVDVPEREKAVELACILALHGHRGLTSEELRAALWPGELGEPGVVAKSLRNTASILRKALGGDLFPEARRGTGYQLAPRVGCDCRIFSELSRSTDGPDEVERLREALSLVRGAPFEGAKSGTYTWAWTEHFVSAIERDIRTAAYRFCEMKLDSGDHEAAIWAALQALMADPYDRRLWELYLTGSAAAGRRALEQAWKEAKGVLLEDAQDLTRLLERLRVPGANDQPRSQFGNRLQPESKDADEPERHVSEPADDGEPQGTGPDAP
jgi:DNA-binding SARP family transcriptional activator